MPRHRTEEKCQLCPELATRAVGAVRIGELCFGRLIDICADAGVEISPDDYRPSHRTNGSKPMSVNIDETEELTGVQIKALREKKGWDQVELARRANLNKWQVEEYEDGKRTPQQKVRERLLKAFAGETEPPAQVVRGARRNIPNRAKRTPPRQRSAPSTVAPNGSTNGTHAQDDATIVLRAIDFDVIGDGSDADTARLEHAFAALESLWRITGAKVALELPPGRHRITPAIAELVLGQRA